MQNKIIIISGASFLDSSLALAENVKLINYGRKGNESPQAISTIPFSVDVTYGHLTLHMTSANNLCLIITGPDGAVLMKEINATGESYESFDLTPYKNGNYEVHIVDAKGNDVSGEFFKGQGDAGSDNDHE